MDEKMNNLLAILIGNGIGCRVLCGVVPVYVLKKFVFPKKYELQSIF